MEKYYKLKVHPSSRKNKILEKGKDFFEIWVKARAERGMANKAAIKMLAETLGERPERIFLVKGAASPSKIVKIL